ncbi:MAG: NHL repeat-containing protein [Actinomycetota bacterium]
MKRTINILLLAVAIGATACTSRTPFSSNKTLTNTNSSSPSMTRGLRRGSDPSVLPGPVLIADENNNRLIEVDPHGHIVWEFPRPGDLLPGQDFVLPDDAFFTPDGRQIIATQEEDFSVALIDIATHRIVWWYGTPGVHGSTANHVRNPDDGLVLPNGYVLLPDIKNCRILLIAPGTHTPSRIYGTTGSCGHNPPRLYAHPNGAFPMRNGHYIVTEINGAYATEVDLSGHVYSAMHIPGFVYPSDTNEVRPGVFLVADYQRPGTIMEFTSTGHVLWRYRPTGKNALDHPSLALPLPNGDVICNDDRNDRIVVVDPRTNRIVWQYGMTRRSGKAAGYLANPDGLDLAPPYSELVILGPHMGLP